MHCRGLRRRPAGLGGALRRRPAGHRPPAPARPPLLGVQPTSSCVAGLALPVLILVPAPAPRALAHAALDYVPFIILLGGLFVISGGILLAGDLAATPRRQHALARRRHAARLLHRHHRRGDAAHPAAAARQRASARASAHTVVFFIFLVANIGGSLTPLGDPPLFLGYPAGVPFFWTLRPVAALAAACAALPARVLLRLGPTRYRARRRRWPRIARDRERQVAGRCNVARLAATSCLLGGRARRRGVSSDAPLARSAGRWLALARGSRLWRTTARARARRTTSRLGPILEVASLFVGIFVTMMPAARDPARARARELGRARAVAVLLGHRARSRRSSTTRRPT